MMPPSPAPVHMEMANKAGGVLVWSIMLVHGVLSCCGYRGGTYTGHCAQVSNQHTPNI